jgi:hypothetical protein
MFSSVEIDVMDGEVWWLEGSSCWKVIGVSLGQSRKWNGVLAVPSIAQAATTSHVLSPHHSIFATVRDTL